MTRNTKQTANPDTNWAYVLPKPKNIPPKDTSGLIPVRIGRRTTVFVKPGTSIEAIKEKYAYLLNSETI